MISPQDFYFGAPFVIAAVCDWLQHDGLPERTNALIVMATVALLSTIWALMNGQFIGSLATDISIVFVGSLFILNLPQLAWIHAWLQRVLVSPFALLPPARIVDSVPPTQPTLRASALGPGKTWTQRPIVDGSVSEQPTQAMPSAPPQGGSVIASPSETTATDRNA